MMKSLNLLVPALVLSGAIALALYAHPRAYRDLTPARSPAETMPTATSEPFPSGSITGRVAWGGPNQFQIPPVEGMMDRTGNGPRWDSVVNPATPYIHSGPVEVVVYLKEVGIRRKPWHHEAVRIEFSSRSVTVVGKFKSRPALFIPVGGEVEIASNDDRYEMIRGRGAAFFTIPLDRAGQTTKRTFDRAGHVELTSGTGKFWSRVDLFVCEHPYYTLTDLDGGFSFDEVPPGNYEVVAWQRNWKILSKDRDPETGKIMRLNFDKPFTTIRPVTIRVGQTANVELQLP